MGACGGVGWVFEFRLGLRDCCLKVGLSLLVNGSCACDLRAGGYIAYFGVGFCCVLLVLLGTYLGLFACSVEFIMVDC